MREVEPHPSSFHGARASYVATNLACTGYVYVRNDTHKHPLQRPYDGPFKIFKTGEKDLQLHNSKDKVSIDRLKTAFIKEFTASDNADVIVTPQQPQSQARPCDPKSAPHPTPRQHSRHRQYPYPEYLHALGELLAPPTGLEMRLTDTFSCFFYNCFSF
ncbi:Pol polyprotein [Elysia marginata]|uniref:Pol polyprotein n=1 Tax=Elysia marginata TaxID=1093978 RepID=A0AAV4G9C2_9GAST|nr:Pol polyprotein [Elysia marginata]